VPVEHFGLNVPDVDEAKKYYDEFMPLVGYMPFFGTGYVPTDWNGAQIFLYPATEEGEHSRLRSGLSHVAFHVDTRAAVHRVHEWVVARGDVVLHAPKGWPEYGEHCYATYFLDPHGFMLEVVCHIPPEESDSHCGFE
jgi:catechol 2,3-dioxygenase-like lactoylglutathione lyase family enzyme